MTTVADAFLFLFLFLCRGTRGGGIITRTRCSRCPRRMVTVTVTWRRGWCGW